MHSFDELIVNLMRLPRVRVDSGIREAQLGDALGHGREGTRNGTSSDGLVGGSGREALPAAVEAIPGGIGKKDLDTSVDRYPREGAGQVKVRAPGSQCWKALELLQLVCSERAPSATLRARPYQWSMSERSGVGAASRVEAADTGS